MPNLCSVIVSMARVHQLTSHLLFKNKQHQLPPKSPVKTSGKGWLIHTAPLNQSQMSPSKTVSLFSSLHPFLKSLILPFASPHIPFPVWNCVDGWSSAVVIWRSRRLSVCLSVSLPPSPASSPFPSPSISRISILSSKSWTCVDRPQHSQSIKVKN